MAKRVITIFTCDICKKASEDYQNYIKLRLPVRENGAYNMWDTDAVDDNVCDCCDECARKIATTIAKTFGYYDFDKDMIVNYNNKSKGE